MFNFIKKTAANVSSNSANNSAGPSTSSSASVSMLSLVATGTTATVSSSKSDHSSELNQQQSAPPPPPPPKKRSASKLSKDELLRLYEIRRSLKLRPKKRKEKEKLPSGIVADYTASLFANMNYETRTIQEQTSMVRQSSGSGSTIVPPLSDSSESSSMASGSGGCGLSESERKPSLYKDAVSSPASLDDDFSIATATSNDSHDFFYSFDRFNTLPDVVQVSDYCKARVVQIHRQNREKTDFGFLLRRAILVRQSSRNKPIDEVVIFAEPGKNENVGLLPGDRLLEINSVSVLNCTRDDIIEKIRNSKSFVTLKVEPAIEYTEISGRCLANCDGNVRFLRGLLRGSDSFAICLRNDEDGADAENETGSEDYWLVHKNGYSGVRRDNDIETSGEQAAVRYQNDGNLVFVDQHFLDRMNPKKEQFASDLISLTFLNETGLVHTLRQRYANNLLYTFVGQRNLIAIRPHTAIAVHSDKVATLFDGCRRSDMPPHVYAIAQAAYFEMHTKEKRSQTIVVEGWQHSGQLTVTKHLADYFCDLRPNSNATIFSKEQLNAVFVVVEAAGLTNSGQVFHFDFDAQGTLVAFSLQHFLLDKFPVHCAHDQVPIFGNFLRYAQNQVQYKSEFKLDGQKLEKFLVHRNSLDEQKHAQCEFLKFTNALHRLNVAEHEIKTVCQLLSAIFHFNNVSVIKNSSGRNQFSDRTSVQNACELLGLNFDQFAKLILGANSVGSMTSTVTTPTSKSSTVTDFLTHFIASLYIEMVNILVFFINRNFTKQLAQPEFVRSIYVVKSPYLRKENSQKNPSLNDLFSNYFNERFQTLFLQKNVLDQMESMKKDNIVYDGMMDVSATQNLTKMIDCKSKLSIFSILDQELNETLFLEQIQKLIEQKDHRSLIRRIGTSSASERLVVQHCQGAYPVVYSTLSWFRDYARLNSAKSINACLQDCSNEQLKKLINESKYLSSIGICNKLKISENNSLLRMSSIRKVASAVASEGGMGASGSVMRKSKSICHHIKLIADNLLDVLKSTDVQFVYCLDAGSSENGDGYVDVPLMRQQIASFGLVNSLRFAKQAFCESLPVKQFVNLFGDGGGDGSSFVWDILHGFDIDMNTVKVSGSKVYFRNGVLRVLEEKRNRKLGPLITNFQAVCRGYLARRISERKRVQDLAVRCIQKNVRAFFQVRSWSWWKLLVQIKPVLNVHRIEDELAARTRDLELVLSKVDRLEEANAKLRAENEKITTQLSELTLDLAEERSSSALLNEKLENEYEEKARLEEKLAQQQQQTIDYCSNNRGRSRKFGDDGDDDELDCARKIANELDLFESNAALATAALVSAANSIANDLSDDSMDQQQQQQLLHTNQNIYKKRLESSNKEIGFLKKRIQEQHECDLEQMIGLKKQLEKKLSDAYEEIDEQRQVAQQWKKKFNKTVDEMSDLKLLLEQQNSRNTQLEKKQKKFDQELTIIMDDLRKEKVLKDRFHREREIINGEKFILESAISELKMEVQIKEEKLESLQREIDEASSSGLSSGEISLLKKQKADLENRVKDFEEELDEMAGQIQMLEQNKVRLEMNLEHSRRENRLESAHKDEELESLRNSYQKRLKSLEMQIETEREERSGLVREKRELERRLNNLLDLDENEQLIDRRLLAKLKKNLAKLSMLYNDAKIELDQLRSDSKNKTIVRQLRNKIDDLETDLQQTMKLRQNLERELNESQSQIDEIRKAKCDAESRVTQLARQLVDLQNQLDDNDEEIGELQRKYEQQIEQITKESLRAQRNHEMNVLESDEQKSHLIEHLTKLTSELEALVVSNRDGNSVDEEVRLKTKELESKLELEQMKRTRLETQINRLKDSMEKSLNELSLAKIKEKQTEDSIRRTQKLLKETKDELLVANNKITDLTLKKTINEKKISNLESELATNRTDLKIAMKRIDDLQSAIRNELDDFDENTLDDLLVQLNSGEEDGEEDDDDGDDEDEGVNKNGDTCGAAGRSSENGFETARDGQTMPDQ